MMALLMERYVPLPPLPERISRLNDLACDLWWSWNAGAREVFRDLDFPLWRFTSHNPVVLLHLVEPDRLEAAAADETFLQLYDRAIAELDAVRSGAGSHRLRTDGPLVWIAPQFALHQSLPVRATSQGIVAGDLAKEASDLGVPFIGIGLMYSRTLTRQRLMGNGVQQEAVEYVDWSDAPIHPARLGNGADARVHVHVAGATIAAAVWEVRAGASRVYLLDTHIPENAAWDRDLSSRNCDGDREARLRQSILLASGAVELIERLETAPRVWHLSGGQAAAVILERLHRLVHRGATFSEASAVVRESTVFGTRIDAPPADDAFPIGALDRQLGATWPALLPHRAAVLALGYHETDRAGTFNTAVLGARKSATLSVGEAGVHLSSWVSAEFAQLFASHVGDDWRDRQLDERAWDALLTMADDEVWQAREHLRAYLVNFMRERARRRWARDHASGSRLVALGTLLDDRALTIGCAPRFGDDGAAVLFDDVDRLSRIFTAARRPVQLVLAGTVDPGNERGRHRLEQAFRHTLDPIFGGRIAFVEDYDLHVARLITQGCDVWLTMPSGGGRSLGAVKAAVNGVPHLGAPGDGEARWRYDEPRALYSVIEEEIVPAFYERSRGTVPERWTAIVRETLAAAVPRYSARRALTAAAGIQV
jgi:glycogen phosphorylase